MYQQVVIVGRLGGDPEMRFTQDGKAVTSFSVAVDAGKDKTTWFRVSAWEKLAETCNQYLQKGKQVLVEGRVSASAYLKDGEARASLDLTAHTVKFLGAKGDEFKPDDVPF